MYFTPKKFYDADPNDGSGGAADPNVVVEPNAGANPEPSKEVTPIFTPEELTSLGFATPEEAKAALVEAVNNKKAAAVTDEEKQKAANLERADMLKYAAENDLVNDDFNNYDSLKSKTDRDLVYNKFAAEFKEDNPEIPEDKLDEETKEAFDVEFKLGSTNAKEKARGESRLAKEAKELRSPAESAYNTVKTGYEERKELMKKGETYAKTFKEVVAAVPDKLEIFKTTLKKDDKDETGDELVSEIELTKEEKEKIQKDYNTEKTLRAYLQADKDGKLEDFKKNLTNKIIRSIRESRQESIYADIVEKAKRIGTKYGSDVGATQTFAIVKNINDNTSGTEKSAKEQAIDSTRRKTSNY